MTATTATIFVQSGKPKLKKKAIQRVKLKKARRKSNKMPISTRNLFVE